MSPLLKFFPGLAPYTLLIELALIALGCSLLIGAWTYEVHQHDAKVRQEAIAPYVQAIENQKAQARQELADLTKQRDALQAQIDHSAQLQEIDDEKRRHDSKASSDALGALVARNGGRLRDPNATGCGRGGASPEGHASAPAADRAGDAAPAGGLLSEPLTRLLRWLADDAQRQADAYAAARADTLMCRAAQGGAP